MTRRKIAVVTGSRAEYGLFRWIIKGIHEDSELELQLLVTGSHLMPEQGMTVQEIEKDGFPIAARVDLHMRGDSQRTVADAIGEGVKGFGQVYQTLQPDIVVLLGDRFEIFAAVAATVPFSIPVAHIHGGEITEGTMDEQFRHAITKMSHLHFTSAEAYRKRVIQMGEQPDRVFTVGAPGLDSVARLNLLDHAALAKDLNIPEAQQWGIVTYHPATRDKDSDHKSRIRVLLGALEKSPQIFWIIGLPNADPGNQAIRSAIESYVAGHPHQARATVSLGQLRYFSLMKHAAVMVGNSSSGIIEAPSFKLPVVNIGDRQLGRARAKNVIDVPEDVAAIKIAIARALSPEFKESLVDLVNPYGDGQASEQIVQIFKKYPLDKGLMRKRFYDLPARI